jgi:hypothetical protein
VWVNNIRCHHLHRGNLRSARNARYLGYRFTRSFSQFIRPALGNAAAGMKF